MSDSHAWLARAEAHERAGRRAEAMADYRRALEQDPRCGRAARGLGVLLLESGECGAALTMIHRAVAAEPGCAANHTAMARALEKSGRMEAALAAHAIAVRLAPDEAEAWQRCARTQRRAGRLVAAEASLQRALACAAPPAGARDLLAQVWFEGARVDEAVEALRAQIARGEASMRTHDRLVFYLHFLPTTTPATLRAAHSAWGAAYAAPHRAEWQAHANEPAPERRLRVGYVSADFREHPVAHAVWPLFAARDRGGHEMVVYSGVRTADAITDRFRGAADQWREVATWSDAELARAVRADGVDILVDLSLHSTGHRLPVFARRPAPVQISWAGYPSGTGLGEGACRLTDRHLDPPATDGAEGERRLRLPDSFWGYSPLNDQGEVSALPALAGGGVTFGCLNKAAKVNAATVRLWSGALRAVPGSRLLLRAEGDMARERIAGWLAQEGVARERVEFIGWSPRAEYLARHRHIDVALDPTPYGGHITLLDALWMGVPTITLPGQTAVSRAGLSLLTTAGLPEWVATDPEHFARIAREQTRDLRRLAELRAGLRARLQASPLMDAARFARGVEAAYRELWRAWCAGPSPRP